MNQVVGNYSSPSMNSSSSSKGYRLPSKPKAVIRFEQKLFVGASAGMFGAALVYPLDIVKTTLQSRSVVPGQSLVSATVSAANSILLSNGFRGFYRGLGACLVGMAPEKALKLAVNDLAKDHITDRNSKKITVSQEVISGCIAGFVQLFVTVPYEAVKIKLQMQGNIPIAERISALQIIQKAGPMGIYRGYTATFLRDVPFCILFFPMYSFLKTAQTQYINGSTTDEEPFHVGLTAGIVAGAVAGGIVTPFDMLKTRIQQGVNGNKGLLAFGAEVVRKEGAAALYRGWHTRMIVIAPLYGLVSLAFEVQKKWLESR